MNTFNSIALAILAASVGNFASLPAHADDASCKPLLDAVAKQFDTPFRETIAGRGHTVEKIVTSAATYLKMPNGKWMKQPTTPQERDEQLRTVRTTTTNCKASGQDTVDGQSTTIYDAHLSGGNMRYWIGANGLPLQGESAAGAKQVKWTFAYDHVVPPPDE